jgi:hypothetical protein
LKKKIKKKPAAGSSAKRVDPVKPDEKEPNQFDFGGLPNRNLKKNLGC